MSQALLRTYTPTTTGALEVLSSPGGAPYATYALCVKGVGAAASSWSVTIDGSLDNANWTAIVTHASADGSIVWDATGKPVTFVRANVGSLTLGSATALSVSIVAVP